MTPRGGVIPLRALVPNAVTMAAFCAGATAIRFAIEGEFARASLAILLAGVLDGVDGRIARLLRGTSRFGAELDSLSDVTAFGIAPALVIYLWALRDIGNLGWLFALLHGVCCALRLARFNAALDTDGLPHTRARVMTGAPAPVGAGMAMAPLYLALGWPGFLDAPMLRAGVAATTLTVSALLMVSTLPTPGWRTIVVPAVWRVPLLAGFALFAGALAGAPFLTLAALTPLYLASVAVTWVRYR